MAIIMIFSQQSKQTYGRSFALSCLFHYVQAIIELVCLSFSQSLHRRRRLPSKETSITSTQ